SHQNSFVGPEPCPSHQLGEETHLTKLTRQAQRRTDLAPRVRTGQTVGEISETINLNKRKRRSGDISRHINAGRASQRKVSDNNKPNSQDRRGDDLVPACVRVSKHHHAECITGVRSRESGVQSLESGVGSAESGVWSAESGVVIRKSQPHDSRLHTP